MQKTKATIVLVLLAAIVVLGGIYLPNPDKRQEYQTVSFCGTEYQAPVIMIDGVDFIKRIAEIASAEPSHETCDQIVGANNSNLNVDYLAEPGLHSLNLNGYLFGIFTGGNGIARPGEHGMEGWAPLR